MCLAIPLKLTEIIDKKTGVVESDGVKNKVGLALLKDPQIGDYVLIHAGYAIEKLDEKEAKIRLDLYKEISEL